MRKPVVLALSVLLLTTVAAGAVSYEISVHDDTAYVNVSFELYAPDQANYFTTNWQVGAGATVIRVRDRQGELRRVEEVEQDMTGVYDREGRRLEISTHSGDARQSATVEVRYRYPVNSQAWKEGLRVVDLQLPGFPDRFEQFDEEQTYVQVNVTEPIIGLAESFGFRSSFTNRTATFQGTGPVNIRVTYSNRDGRYEHFIMFGDANLSHADEVYPLANQVTGRAVDFRKIPVVILSDEQYTRHLDAWSAGRYRRGGLVFIRKNQVDENDFAGLVMHEVMHAFNAKPLNWVQTNSSMFDEGTSKYVEFLVNEKRGHHQAEIFGQEVTWTAQCRDSERTCRYTLDPRGTPEDLWNYYQQGRDFMTAWSPSEEGQIRSGLSLRTFGYAYAELLIRNYIRKNSPAKLHDVYDDLMAVEEPADTASAYRSTLRRVLGTGLEPCHAPTEESVRQCLENVHSFMPNIPTNVVIDGRTENITFRKVEVPTATGTSENGNASLEVTPAEGSPGRTEFLEGFLRFLAETARRLINAVSKVIQ
ncbi:MAG: hypothetical protein SV186_01690 [Candidatus Nanohaloarchaea archaeon]|nr:hypothetical protein [Candidatus Nanohaloarchaea archaeon]